MILSGIAMTKTIKKYCIIFNKEPTFLKISAKPPKIKPMPNMLNMPINIDNKTVSILISNWYPVVNMIINNRAMDVIRFTINVEILLAVTIVESLIPDMFNCSNVPLSASFISPYATFE